MELLLNFAPYGVNVSTLTVLTAVKINVIVLCNTHTREMLLSLPAAAAHLLLLCHYAAVLHKCNWYGYVITS